MSTVARLRRLRVLLPRAASRAPLEADLWARGMVAGRASSTALALALFVLGLTLDDLHLFRFPMMYVGVAAAILAFGALPPVFASSLVRKARVDSPEAPAFLLDNAVVRRRAILLATVGLFLFWLVLFSSGRTPRW